METFGIQEKKEVKRHQRSYHLRGKYVHKRMMEKLTANNEAEAKKNEIIQRRMNNPMKCFGGHNRYPLTLKYLHEDFGKFMKSGRKPYYYSTESRFMRTMEKFKGDVNPNLLFDKLRFFYEWAIGNTILVQEDVYDLLIHHNQALDDVDDEETLESQEKEIPAEKVVVDLFTQCDPNCVRSDEASSKPYIPGYLSRFQDLTNFVPSKARIKEYQRARELGIKKSSAKYLYWLIGQGDLDLVLSFSFSVATSHEDERFDTQVRYVQAIVRYVLQSDQTDYSRDSQGCLQLMKHLWSINDDSQLDFLANIL